MYKYILRVEKTFSMILKWNMFVISKVESEKRGEKYCETVEWIVNVDVHVQVIAEKNGFHFVFSFKSGKLLHFITFTLPL